MRQSETLGPVLLAVTVGLVAGVGAILFRKLIFGTEKLFFEGGAQVLPFLGESYVILLPAVGLVIVSFIVRKWAPEAQGHGVPEVMYAVNKEGGRIRPRVAGIKAFASAICIGSGGSVGREGPIVQIGCTVGSTIGQVLGMNEQRVKLLVACGAAAGVAGTFNAPIAGVLFALEVILGNFTGKAFGLVVISSVTSTALGRAVLGKAPAFAMVQEFSLHSGWEFPLYLALGLLAGVVALAFVRTLYFVEGIFQRWKWHYAVKAVVGGLAVGAIGYFGEGNHLFGVGYEGIEASLSGNLGIDILLILVFLKILATSMTLGGGGSGGVFAPSLFIGAMLGGAFGIGVNALFDGVAPPGAYALVGMAAVFAGAAHAPITAIVILFEMTDDYLIILPLMFAAVVSYLVAQSLSADSIYTIKLRRRGGLRPKRSEVSVLDFILVTDAMTTDFETVRPDVPLSELAVTFHEDHVRALPVVDEESGLVGIVSAYDVETAIISGNLNDRAAKDIMTRSVLTCTGDQRMRDVLELFTSRDVGQIPVVDKENPKKLVGVLRRKEIFWAYGVIAKEHQRMLDRTGIGLPSSQKDSVQVEIEIKPVHRNLCGRRVKEIEVPDQCLIVMLRRADQAIIPRGKTVIESGDTLVVLTTRKNEMNLLAWADHLDDESPVE